MELELQKTQLAGYEAVLDTTVAHEETLEMIVPDACPDILRIVNTEGSIFLKSKECMDGRVELSGVARAAVLYLPDGESGVRRLDVNIPFRCGAEGSRLKSGCLVVAVPQVRSADTRSLNPRKVLTRIDLTVAVQVWSPVAIQACGGIDAEERLGIQQMGEAHNTYMTTSIQEKPFTFSDDVAISPSRPGAEELLRHRVELFCNESKIIGNKLIFKGEASLQVLYRSAAGALCTNRWELPFSQIMEVIGVGEEADCDLRVICMGSEVTLSPDPACEGRSLAVSLSLLAQAVVCEERTLALVCDAYSTACPLRIERENYRFQHRLEENTARQMLREVLECEGEPRSVEDVFVTLGKTTMEHDGTRMTLSVETAVTVLYYSEDDALRSAMREFPVSCQIVLPENCQCRFWCRCLPDAQATPTSSGLEIRYGIEFFYRTAQEVQVIAITNAKAEECAAGEDQARPSVVLRVVGGGERLWDIAKHYRTTVENIMVANELEHDHPEKDSLLLIPKNR